MRDHGCSALKCSVGLQWRKHSTGIAKVNSRTCGLLVDGHVEDGQRLEGQRILDLVQDGAALLLLRKVMSLHPLSMHAACQGCTRRYNSRLWESSNMVGENRQCKSAIPSPPPCPRPQRRCRCRPAWTRQRSRRCGLHAGV